MALEQLEDKFDALCKESNKLNADFNGIISKFRTYSQSTGLFCGGISGYMQQFGHAMSKKFSQIILPMFGVFFICSLVPVWTTYTVLQPIVRAAERLHKRFRTLGEEANKLVLVEGGGAEVARNTAVVGHENVEVARDIERGNVEGEGDVERGNVGRGIDPEAGNVDVVVPPLQNLLGENAGRGIKAAAGNVVATSQNGRRVTAKEKGELLEKIAKELEQLETWKRRHLKFLLLEILNGFLLDVLLVTTITGVYHMSVEHNKRP